MTATITYTDGLTLPEIRLLLGSRCPAVRLRPIGF